MARKTWLVLALLTPAAAADTGMIRTSDHGTADIVTDRTPTATPLHAVGQPVTLTEGLPGDLAADNRVQLDMVHIGDADNANSSLGDGAVDYDYRYARHEVTNAQYAAMLNAVASHDDPFGLFDDAMAARPEGGILQVPASGGDPGWVYVCKSNMADKPVNFVTWMDAARFVNWLENGQPIGRQDVGTTETGTYDLTEGDGFYYDGQRDPNAAWVLPTQDEWRKAGFFDPNMGDYWTFATRSDEAPEAGPADLAGDFDAAVDNGANFGRMANWNGTTAGNVVTVGSVGAGSRSAYGVADLNGNVSEWTEDIECLGNLCGRDIKGGSYAAQAPQSEQMIHGLLTRYAPIYGIDGETFRSPQVGFRVAFIPDNAGRPQRRGPAP